MAEEQQQIHEHVHNPDLHYLLAFVIDGEVVDTLHVHEHLGAVLLSDPLIIDVTDKHNQIHIGSKYNTETGEFLND